VQKAWTLIASLTSPPYVAASRQLLIGLDESGTTEPVGPPFMVAAILPATLAPRVWEVIELADTKGKRHAPSYWKGLVDELVPLGAEGLDFVVADIPTSRCENRAAKPLLDLVVNTSARISRYTASPRDCRVVIDN
jgi:hypothetical protein